MSMSAVINGADCGPVNPLQGLSKQLDRDRGVQQDHFGATNSHAGPSRFGFRTVSETPQSSRFAQEASQFFSNAQFPSTLPQARPFTPSMLSKPAMGSSSMKNVPHSSELLSQDERRIAGTSPVSPLRAHQDPNIALAVADWAADFNINNVSAISGEPTPASAALAPYSSHMAKPYVPMPMGLGASQHMHKPSWNVQSSSVSSSIDREAVAADWAATFESVEKEALNATTVTSQPVVEPSSSSITVEDLSATAALLISSVQHETNPKFRNSEFMGLMHRLRDRQAIVDGNTIVEMDDSTAASTSTPVQTRKAVAWQDGFLSGSVSLSSALDKGKARAIDTESGSSYRQGPLPSTTSYAIAPGFYDTIAVQGGDPSLYSGVLAEEMQGATSVTASASASAHLQEDSLANYFEQLGFDEEDEGQELLGKDYLLNNDALNGAERYAELGRMQAEWDALDAAIAAETSSRSASASSSGYQFHDSNPYMETGQLGSERASANPSALPYQTVLQTEAAVQHDPTNASAWFMLGVRQQENEREDSAIKALNRAVQLDPKHGAALLALAVSHTNENDRGAAIDAIERWVDASAEANEIYRDAVRARRALYRPPEGGLFDRQRDLVECLMTMARAAPDGQIDADIQIALGVLLNASEEYDKARDCFQTALAVRPDDPLLYNRVGATLANSGRAQEALDYYYRALELNPSYIRARFNLGISCINLKLFIEAARHILDALVLQDADASPQANGAGISSSSLWNSLRTTCMQMQRHDLVTLCEAEDLASFREAFEASGA